jgi:hypothetical protein
MTRKYELIHVTASGAVPFALFFFVVVFCLRFLTGKPTSFFVFFVLMSRSSSSVQVLPVAFLFFLLLLVTDAPPASKIRSVCQSVFSVLGAWLCRSPPPWWVQCPFPAEHGALWSLPLLISPLLHPVLGVSKTAFGMVDKTEVDSPTLVKTVYLTSLAVSLLATRVLSEALLYPCSILSTLSTGTYSPSIFSGTGMQATKPNVSYSS